MMTIRCLGIQLLELNIWNQKYRTKLSQMHATNPVGRLNQVDCIAFLKNWFEKLKPDHWSDLTVTAKGWEASKGKLPIAKLVV